ncbi:MAG: hypothetical protein AAGF95_22990 [Chloroflexota bacterium]
MRKKTIVDSTFAYMVHVRKQTQESSNCFYHITLYSPEYVPLRDWHDEYSKHALNALLDDLQRQYRKLSKFFVDPSDDIDSIFHNLEGDLCQISAWYRPNRALVEQQHDYILTAVQSMASMVKHEAQPLVSYYTGEVRLLKSRLWWDFYDVEVIENYTNVHATFNGWYTSSGLSDQLYQRYPSLQTYRITWPQKENGLLFWIGSAIQSFRANCMEHGHRLSNSQKGGLRQILHHLEELFQE